MRILFIFLITLLLAACSKSEKKQQLPLINHRLSAAVEPQEHALTVVDTITFPADYRPAQWIFMLNKDLKVSSADKNVQINLLKSGVKASDTGMDMEAPEVADRIKQNKYELKFKSKPQGKFSVVLQFFGKIYNEVKPISEEYARGFSTSPGIISEQGVYLAGSSDWIPWFDDALVTFRLEASLPEEWDVVSQGERTRHTIENGRRTVSWLSKEPMEEIFLIAAKFTEYERQVSNVHVMAFLRTPDEGLANKYLETTGQYLEMYRQLIGPYPFWKFALVENFWETGYGMPSFTLLGPQIIRFPFILHSSYPHELLHNWWGNSVYVDFDKGNWCEGLTVYMADHLIKEQRGQGGAYRRSTLQKYTDYVNPQNDFPLSKFLSRHSAATEAVGYGKCMMIWDMLREDTGDKNFIKAVQKFYRDNKFKKASFADLRRAFEAVSGNDYKAFFKQWVQRTGAPQLELSAVSVKQEGQKYILDFTLSQVQKEAPFDLKVPVAVSFSKEVQIQKVQLNAKQQNYRLKFEQRPLMLRVDPRFHVFRRLHYNEIPPALSKIFGAQKVLMVLPKKALPALQKGYRQLANIWSRDKSKDIEIKTDEQLSELPSDRAVWLFGKNNRLRTVVETGLKDYDAAVQGEDVRLEKTELSLKDKSVVISIRHPQNPQSVVVWLSAAQADAVPGLARKLPHYGKYSYLAFAGSEPTNMAKGQWPAVHSPLSAVIPLQDGSLPKDFKKELPKRPALAQLAPLFSARRMMKHIKYLSGDELQGRGLGSMGIEKAARYIVQQFKASGLQPGADDGSYFQKWQEVVDADGHKGTIKNIIGVIPGTNPRYAGQAVVVSAHYDHLGLGWPDVRKGNEGKIHHGADDNASGIAVMLELAKNLGKSLKPERSIVFVAFTAEESGLKGSQYFVKHYKRFPAKKIIADLNLDTVGRLNGKKLLILNSSSAKEWPFIFMGVGYVTGVQSEMVTQQLDASDQVSFVKAGVPAVQIFSGAHRDYHRPTDTWDKIDADGLVKVAAFTREALLYLAERETPLIFLGQTGGGAAKHPAAAKGTRRVSTGTMPDFAYQGKGVRIQNIAPDSPAQKAGLKAGDVIVQLQDIKINDLRDYSNALKKHQPGDVVQFTVERNGERKQLKVKLTER